MAAIRRLDFEHATDSFDEEDEDTLAAIDEGIRAADEGRLLPEDEVRKLIPEWISKYSTQSPR